MNFTPRQVQILFLLIKSDRVIPTEELSRNLQISKRTLFRELKGMNRELEKYGLYLDSQSKKGLVLSGDEERKTELLTILEKSQSFDPRNKKERRKKLVGLLIRSQDVQKTFYYANQLQVSESTISNDLEDLQHWFIKSGIRLVKRTGYGIQLEYREEDFRRMILAYVQEFPEEEILQNHVEEAVKKSLTGLSDRLMNQFTAESVKSLISFLEIAVSRIGKGYELEETGAAAKEDELSALVRDIAGRLEQSFDIRFSQPEREAVRIFLKSAGRQQSNREEYMEIAGESVSLKKIVYTMTDVFKPEVSFELKTDDIFLEGMMTHLRPAITRMMHGIPIQNALLTEIQTIYPDVYAYSLEAAKILEERLGCRVSEEETGYLALHFGSAIVRLREKKKKRRQVDIGVLCANGIGISNLISSRLVQYFGNRIQTRILTIRDLENIDRDEVDFVVSSFDIKSEKVPVVQVMPIMKKHDFHLIDHYVEAVSIREKVTSQKKKKGSVLHNMLQITKEVDSLLEDFQFLYMRRETSFEEMLGRIGKTFGKNEGDSLEIVTDLEEREALSSQVIPEYEIAFLHCRTDAVASSKMMIILPDGTKFSDPYFCDSKAVIVMLINKQEERDTLAVSAISNAVFGEDEFLDDIKNGREEQVQQQIEKILNDFLQENVKEMYAK